MASQMTEREYYDEEFVIRMTSAQKDALMRAARAVGEPLAVYIRRAVAARIGQEGTSFE